MAKKLIPQDLIKKYIDGTCTEQEKAIVESWHLKDIADSSSLPSQQKITEVHNRMRKDVLLHAGKADITIKLWPRIAVAASILLCLSVGGYFLLHKKAIAPIQVAQVDFQPGSNKAILTLASGKKISLTDAKNGKLAQEGNSEINKTADGQVIYESSKSEIEHPKSEIPYNTLETPNGGTYQVKLPDGTQVWLNSASSLKYPSAFTGKDRKVELTGEAYFEVAHNSARPFRVIAVGETVEDIGTHFNINAYTDEPAIKTTLLEGAVKVTYKAPSPLEKAGDEATKAGAILKPGQQSQIKISEINPKIGVIQADLEQTIAWKNGIFQYSNASIQEIMRQAARWYNVQIAYEGPVTTKRFGGTISRNVPASKFLEILKFSGVKFRTENKKIIITN